MQQSGTVPHTRARQIFCTVDLLTPDCLAIVRVLQCVSPLGLECRVASTIASTRLHRDRRLGPPALADLAQLASPFSANRVRHARTVTAVTPKLAAIRVLATPSAAINSARARADLSMRSLTTSAIC